MKKMAQIAFLCGLAWSSGITALQSQALRVNQSYPAQIAAKAEVASDLAKLHILGGALGFYGGIALPFDPDVACAAVLYPVAGTIVYATNKNKPVDSGCLVISMSAATAAGFTLAGCCWYKLGTCLIGFIKS